MPEATIHLGEALTVLRGMPDASAGHVVVDPPYGQTNESYESAVAFDPALWAECHRVAGPNAALISFAGSPTYHKIATAIEAGGWRVRQMWGWVYRDGMITSAYPKEGFDRLAPAFDPIVFATKGKVILNLSREGEPWSMRSRSKRGPMSDRFRSPELLAADGRYPKSLASDGSEPFEYFAASRQPRGETRFGHPNQKPLALMRWLVSKLPQPGPILDPFAGSATTLIAALDCGFDAVGIERDPEYRAMGLDRIEAVRTATPLFA